MALEYAGYYPPSDEYPEDYDGEVMDECDPNCISDNIEGYAEPYDPEKHDMHRAGGGSFMYDIARKEAR